MRSLRFAVDDEPTYDPRYEEPRDNPAGFDPRDDPRYDPSYEEPRVNPRFDPRDDPRYDPAYDRSYPADREYRDYYDRR